jgi:hypothetical protein
MDTWNDVFAAFPTTADLARGMDAKYQTAAAWKRRNCIPPRRWPDLVDLAERKAIPNLTFDTLRRLDSQAAA